MNTTNIKHATIMAAGRGTRMLPFTQVIPKPMMPFHGSTLIANGIGKIAKTIPNIHITVGYKGAALADHVIQQGVSSVFNTEGKGNAWWIYNTMLKHLDEPTFVLTCDNVCELDFAEIAADYYDLGEPACMVVPVEPVEGLDGDFIFHDDKQIIEKLDRHTPSNIYCTGIQILNPAKVNRLTKPDEDFYALWEQLMKQDQMMCSRVRPKSWFTVDTPEQLKQLEARGDVA